MKNYNKIVSIALTSTEKTMPEYKAVHFVGKAQLTPYQAIKQYMMEIETRQGAIEKTEFSIEELQIDIDEIDDHLEHEENKFAIRRLENQRRDKVSQQKAYKKNLTRSINERDQYVKLIDDVDQSEHGTLHDGRRILDCVANPEENEDLERDYWILRMGKQAAMDMIAYGRVGVGNMDSLTMMNQEDQRKALALATDVFVWHENRMNFILKDSNEKYKQLEHTDLTKSLMLTRE